MTNDFLVLSGCEPPQLLTFQVILTFPGGSCLPRVAVALCSGTPMTPQLPRLQPVGGYPIYRKETFGNTGCLCIALQSMRYTKFNYDKSLARLSGY